MELVFLKNLPLYLAQVPILRELMVAPRTERWARLISRQAGGRMATVRRSRSKRQLRQLPRADRKAVALRMEQLGEARLKARLAPPKDQASRSRREWHNHQEKALT